MMKKTGLSFYTISENKRSMRHSMMYNRIKIHYSYIPSFFFFFLNSLKLLEFVYKYFFFLFFISHLSTSISIHIKKSLKQMPFCRCGELCFNDKCNKCGFNFQCKNFFFCTCVNLK